MALVVSAMLGLAGSAQAERVLVLGGNGKVSVRTDRYAPVAQPIGSPLGEGGSPLQRLRAHEQGTASGAATAGPTVLAALQSLYAQGQI
jgi:hypothetical protein